MTTRAFPGWMTVALCAGVAAALVPAPLGAADANKACGLLTPAELEAALGAKVTLGGGGPMTPSVTVCTGGTPTATVMLRLVTGLDPGRDRSGGREMKGLEIVKKMGAQVEVKTFGPMTCSSTVPPASLAQYGFNTTCTVGKPTALAGIEVVAKSQKDMISIERLRPLAEKMTSRF
jgi:hypothetical protein